MNPKKVAIEDPELLERYTEIARCEGKTVDELTTEAVKRDVARRWLEKNKREAVLRRGNMTDDEVDAIVEKAVQKTVRSSCASLTQSSPRRSASIKIQTASEFLREFQSRTR